MAAGGDPATHNRWARALIGLVLASGLAIAWTGSALAAIQSWTITADKVSVQLGVPTTVTLRITNTSSDNGGGSGIACVTVAIPSVFTISGVSVASVSSGSWWTAAISATAPRGVTANADSNVGRLRGDPDDDVLVLKITVIGTALGLTTWTANELQNANCSGSYAKPKSLVMTVLPVPLSTPTPTPTPSPSPIPTASPSPTPTSAPTPSPTPSPTGSPGPTPVPTTSPTPTPTTGPTDRPSSAPSATPGDRPTPDPGGSSPPGTGGGTTGSTGGGPTGSSGGDPGSTGGAGAGRPPIEIVGLDPGSVSGPSLAVDLGLFEWAMPSALMAGPGLLILLLIGAQAVGALAWLPLIRRKLGSFGFGHRRPPAAAA